MKTPKRSLVAAAVLLALAAAPAHAVLERMGPISNAPSIGGYPLWFQDRTGITLEFCDPKTQAEMDGGWCVVFEGTAPESFPLSYSDEHFYYAADNVLRDDGLDFRARLVIAIEAAFANDVVVEGDQVTFGRQRIVIDNLPFAGDYRVITPYSDTTYPNQLAGDRIAVTTDIGLACVGTFECTLKTGIGPFLLPSAVAGGAEVPPMPALKSAPTGTDPFYDALVFTGGVTADPQTGRQYLADPARVGPVTGSPLPGFVDSTGATRNHNTFRIEVRPTGSTSDSPVLYTIEGENNFTVAGRLLTGTLPGKVTPTRATYKADGVGNVTVLEAFANASPTTQARLPAQPQQPPLMPVLSYYGEPCAGAVAVLPETGLTVVNPPPYGPPAGTPQAMSQAGTTFWGQSQPGGLPPSHVCIVDASARSASGETVPAYYLQRVADTVRVTAADYDGPNGGKLSVSAISSDPTAVLTLTGYGPANAAAPGTASATAPGTGLDLAGNMATVSGLMAAPAAVHVVSSRGGASVRETETALGAATGGGGGSGGGDTGGTPVIGTPIAVNETGTILEDCSATAASVCGAGQSLAVDLLGNDTILVNGAVKTLRDFVRQGLGTATVTAQAPRLGLANITADGIISYVPNPNASGTDSITYTVAVDGKVSNQAILAINVTPVNDLPTAGSTSTGAVMGRANSFNLLTTSTDPDGVADLRDAAIVSWPAQLGPQPTPVNGVVGYTPTTNGTYNIVYQVRDAAGALSVNTALGSVTVTTAEIVGITSARFTTAGSSTRWVVTGSDNVAAGQTMTIVYNDGRLRSGASCDGTATNPGCVVGTAVVDGAGNWALDKSGTTGGTLDPNDTATWSLGPRRINVFSSAPVLGGSQTAAIVTR